MFRSKDTSHLSVTQTPKSLWILIIFFYPTDKSAFGFCFCTFSHLVPSSFRARPFPSLQDEAELGLGCSTVTEPVALIAPLFPDTWRVSQEIGQVPLRWPGVLCHAAVF